MENITQKINIVNNIKYEQFNSIVINYKNDNVLNYSEVIFLKELNYKYLNLSSKTYVPKKSISSSTSSAKEKYINENANKAKIKLKRLMINNNLWNHCGFTYKDEVTDRKKLVLDFIKFIKRLEYILKIKLDYVAVPEIQKERYLKTLLKIYHMHVGLNIEVSEKQFFAAWNSKKCLTCPKYAEKNFNFQCKDCPKFKGLVWVDRQKGEKNVFKNASYFAKYFSKGFNDDLNQRVKLKEHRYFCSKNLSLPEIKYQFISEDELKKIEHISEYNKKFDDGNSYHLLKNASLEFILNK